jgi:hypothetical protein
MRNIILAGLALSLAAGEARAAAPDTSRVPVPVARGASRDEPAEFRVHDVSDVSVRLTDASRYVEGRRDYQDQDYYDRQQGDLRVRVWLDNDRDVLRLNDRTRVLVRTNGDAYVAVIHIDTNGDVEFIYPSSPYDDGFLRGGRSYALPARGSGWLNIRGGYGIGYVFAIASEEPLDLQRYRDSWYRSARWDRGRNVYGDPFYAMERFERNLVRDLDYGYHDTDYYSYHVGQRYSYPRYACYEDYGSWYYSRSTYWGGCDRVRVLLIERPYYYDTRYYHGDRRYYYRRYYGDTYAGRQREPQHGYKDREQTSGTGNVPPLRRRGSGLSSPRNIDGQRRRTDEGTTQEPRVQTPERTRPTFGRRAEPSEPPAERRSEPRRSEPREQPSYEPRRSPAPERSQPRSEPRAEPRREEPRAEPRRESPRAESPRSEPRRESPPPSRSPSREPAPRSRPPS